MIGTLYQAGLQNFNFQESIYNVIWCQWVLGVIVVSLELWIFGGFNHEPLLSRGHGLKLLLS